MSSAKSVSLISSSLTNIPLISLSSRIRQASTSRARMNSKGDKGSPRLTPHLTENRSVVKPLFRTQLDKKTSCKHRGVLPLDWVFRC